jgi:hypothetical protein
VPNKATTNAREAIARFVDGNSDQLQELLEEIRKVHGPKAAWDCIMDLVEYHVPKLQRTELTGKDGSPFQVTIVDPTRRADRAAVQLDHKTLPG